MGCEGGEWGYEGENTTGVCLLRENDEGLWRGNRMTMRLTCLFLSGFGGMFR